MERRRSLARRNDHFQADEKFRIAIEPQLPGDARSRAISADDESNAMLFDPIFSHNGDRSRLAGNQL